MGRSVRTYVHKQGEWTLSMTLHPRRPQPALPGPIAIGLLPTQPYVALVPSTSLRLSQPITPPLRSDDSPSPSNPRARQRILRVIDLTRPPEALTSPGTSFGVPMEMSSRPMSWHSHDDTETGAVIELYLPLPSADASSPTRDEYVVDDEHARPALEERELQQHHDATMRSHLIADRLPISRAGGKPSGLKAQEARRNAELAGMMKTAVVAGFQTVISQYSTRWATPANRPFLLHPRWNRPLLSPPKRALPAHDVGNRPRPRSKSPSDGLPRTLSSAQAGPI